MPPYTWGRALTNSVKAIKMVGRKLCEKGAWMQKGPILCGVVRENTPDEENI